MKQFFDKTPFAFLTIAVFVVVPLTSAQESSLSVQKIMQKPETWVGVSPNRPFWSEDGSTLYFYWNPQGTLPADSLYRLSQRGDVVKVPADERRSLGPSFSGWEHGRLTYSSDFKKKVFARNGDIFLYERDSKTTKRLTRTNAIERNPRFSQDETGIVFSRDNNLYELRETGLRQLTDIRSGREDEESEADDSFLEAQQYELFDVLVRERTEREQREAWRDGEEESQNLPPTFYSGDKSIQQLKVDPNGRFVTFLLSTSPRDSKFTEVQQFVTETGFTETMRARPKVGADQASAAFFIQDLERDTTYEVDLHQLEGAYDIPAYLRDQTETVDSSETKRQLNAYGPYWSVDGAYAVLEIRALDNKDRWIARLEPVDGQITVLDRQTDDAWLAGPGIAWWGGSGDVGWLPDNRHFYFQSEKTGYSHLYVVDVQTGVVRQLTEGAFEVFSPTLSKDGQTWFFTSSEESPFVRHFYSMPVSGGPRTRLTTMAGNNQVVLNPDEQRKAILFSYTNQPPELYVKDNAETAVQVTNSTTEEWKSYSWRDPDIIEIEASDGVNVPAQWFEPESPNGAAVLFVHGAGYLQNVHKWWSSYFREYMFHNLLADLGYHVLNVDYRGSAGYGRGWRTAIYRHMGERDLADYVDASRFLQEKGIDPERVFIYGGSYGGFITLMALFNEPEMFGGGAALRAVTDWAHYNHTYTANILNTPEQDSLAFRRSSPIYFAEGLEDPLLIAHGMVDANVQFQDVVRLAQKLIELRKEDWEMAVYPVEGHSFSEPESWTDEYRRILEYIEKSVGPERE